MTVPNHLNTTICPYEYHQISAITDVETGGVGIISSSRTYLVTNRGWTEPSTALFQSPTDPGGRWLDILMTRISATEIELRVRDHLGHTIITRRIDIDVAGTAINFWAGKFFHRIESLRATPECFQAELLEVSPDDDNAVQFAVYATAYRTSASSVDGNGSSAGGGFIWEENTGTSIARNDRCAGVGAFDLGGGAVGRAVMGSGDTMVDDVYIGTVVAGNNRGAGRLYHAYLVPSTFSFGSDKTLEVDDNVTATFRVVGLATSNTERLAYRKSDP